eukprot:14449395-Heterocapsa_arctica.AAC.1
MKELNRLPTLILTTDSSSAANSTKRRGLGRMRHMDIRELWLQDEVRAGAVKIEKIEGLKNVADMLTKALPRPRFNELSTLLGLVDEQDDKEVRRSEGVQPLVRSTIRVVG